MEKSVIMNRIARNLQKDEVQSKIGQEKIEFYHLDKMEIKQVLQIIFKVFSGMEIEDEKFDLHDEFSMEESVGFVVEKTTQVAGKDSAYQPVLADIQQCLTHEEHKEILLLILDYLLERFEYLSERAVLSKFLALPAPDPMYMGEEDVANAWENYKTLQQMFKQAHTDLKNANKQKGDKSLEEVRRDCEKMRAEIENLQNKVQANKAKLLQDAEAASLFSQILNLQSIREESEALMREYETRKNQFDVAEVRLEYEQKHLDQLQRSVAPDPQDLIMNVNAELRSKSEQKERILSDEAALEEKSRLLECAEREDWSRVLESWGLPRNLIEMAHDSGTSGLNQLADELQTEVRNLTQTALDLDSDPEALKARNVIQKQVGNMEKQLRSLEEEVRAEEERNAELSQQNAVFEAKIKDLEHLFTPNTMKFKDDLKEELKRSLEQHKKLTREYDALRAHKVDIERTKILLENELESITRQLESQESRHGVAGFSAAQGQLEKVSTLKSEIDERKGQTLNEFSNVVEDLREKMAEKRAEMEEPLREVQSRRKEVAELKLQHSELKAQYDAVKSTFETQRNHVERTVTGLRSEMSGYQTRLFQLNSAIQKLSYEDEQIKKELKAYTSADAAAKKSTLRELYNSKLNDQVNLGKQLRNRKKEVMEGEGNLKQQKEQWEGVERLMKLKLESLSRRKQEFAQAQAELHNDEERLVIQ